MERPRNVNRHHTFWEAKQYRRNSVLTKLRNHHGFIIPMNIYDHRDLHHELDPGPPRLRPSQAEELLEHVGNYDGQTDRLHYVDEAIGFFVVKDQIEIAEHFEAQREFMMIHPMTAHERDLYNMYRDLRNN